MLRSDKLVFKLMKRSKLAYIQQDDGCCRGKGTSSYSIWSVSSAGKVVAVSWPCPPCVLQTYVCMYVSYRDGSEQWCDARTYHRLRKASLDSSLYTLWLIAIVHMRHFDKQDHAFQGLSS